MLIHKRIIYKVIRNLGDIDKPLHIYWYSSLIAFPSIYIKHIEVIGNLKGIVSAFLFA